MIIHLSNTNYTDHKYIEPNHPTCIHTLSEEIVTNPTKMRNGHGANY